MVQPTNTVTRQGICRVVIADDHTLFRHGIRLLLDDPFFDVVAETGSYADAVHQIRRHRPDLLILDLNLGNRNVLSDIPHLAAESPGTGILVLTMHDDPSYAQEALRSGARGYLCKEATADELESAARALHSGGTYLDTSLGARLATLPDNAPPDGMTEREQEVLSKIAAGLTNQEIARSLFVSLRTVESLRASLRMKLDLRTRAELSEYARTKGLLVG
ncbi:response regulator transcription factor [Streptomyces sp. NPDC005438]|uniref:response regulator transcription factor n=1 Tax=Streptomyces sp. NPDC005438 TaxID=3156880 RepID=UPI0033A5C235